MTLVFCLCSVLSKEQGITVVAVCVTYEFFVVYKVNNPSNHTLFYNQRRNVARCCHENCFLSILGECGGKPERVSTYTSMHVVIVYLLLCLIPRPMHIQYGIRVLQVMKNERWG